MNLPVNYNAIHWRKRKLVREEYIKHQKGKCYYCGQSLKEKPCSCIQCLPINKNLFPNNFFNYPIHLHHDHDTGMTVGAVHNYCNAVLWQYHGK